MHTPAPHTAAPNAIRYRGTVKWFNPDKGYGFITPDSRDGYEKDVFVHINALNQSGINPRDMWDGRRVEYSTEVSKKGAGKPAAVALVLQE